MNKSHDVLQGIAETGRGWEQLVATQLVALSSTDLDTDGTTDPFANTAVERLVQQGVLTEQDLEDHTGLSLRLASLYEGLAQQFDPTGIQVQVLDEAAVMQRVPYYVEKFLMLKSIKQSSIEAFIRFIVMSFSPFFSRKSLSSSSLPFVTR